MFIKTQIAVDGSSLLNLDKFYQLSAEEILKGVWDVYLVIDYEETENDDCNKIGIGEYETESRAWEVINEIYRALTRGENTYEMPEK